MPHPASADFLRQPLAEVIDLRHPLAVLANRLPWAQIEAALAPHFARQVREGHAVAQDDLFGPSLQAAGAGVTAADRLRLALRLMAGLLYLKHAYKLIDEELVQRWAENLVWQHFSGLTFYEPRLPCDATQIGRFRSAIGVAGMEELLKATIDTAVASKAIKPAEFEQLIMDTTVQDKAIAHPVDSRLLKIARHKVMAAAKRAGIALKQTFVKEGKRRRRRTGVPAATPTPSSSSDCARRCSNASARSWTSCCTRCCARRGTTSDGCCGPLCIWGSRAFFAPIFAVSSRWLQR